MGPTLTKEAPRRYLRFKVVSLAIVDHLGGSDHLDDLGDIDEVGDLGDKEEGVTRRESCQRSSPQSRSNHSKSQAGTP